MGIAGSEKRNSSPRPNNWSEDNVWVDELGQSGRPDLVEQRARQC